jgi:hypothetical protein
MLVCDVHKDGFQLKARVVFGVKEPHPHVMCVVVDDDQAVTEATWGGDIQWTPKVRGHVEKGTGWLSARSSVALCKSGLVEQA